jgi:hypothetical protein
MNITTQKPGLIVIRAFLREFIIHEKAAMVLTLTNSAAVGLSLPITSGYSAVKRPSDGE